MNKCNVCQELQGVAVEGCDPRYQVLVNSRQNIIHESADFVVIPSLGPLNDSHVMIVPKAHVNNFSVIHDSKLAQVRAILQALSSYIESKHGRSLVFFESGAGIRANHSGGCIVHAHIHCVYEQEEFERRLFQEVDFKEGGISWYAGADGDLGYVWYMDGKGKAALCNNPQLPSQFLRYVYSMGNGDIRFWNWRRHNNFEGVLKVVDCYKGFKKYMETLQIIQE
ncbi:MULTISPECIES: HIT family protein [unclassified Pseudomonas]|uniref:HIT family protein n=1 Tax=unclassified Pseudomonas TaxID=196821 RepID=UPI000A1E5023|nr:MULTISPECIES: HIT domain-containing protein [unclassified Pseudomonas]